MGDQPDARPLPTHNTEKRGHTSVPRAGFEPVIPVFERPKTVRALDRTAIGTGRGRKYRWEFVDSFPEISVVTITDSGLISEDSFRSWLHRFQVHRVAGLCPLLIDGHTSHTNLQALEFYEDNNIRKACLQVTQRVEFNHWTENSSSLLSHIMITHSSFPVL
jgi:hypothetical protein